MRMPPSLQAGFQGTAASFTNSLSNEPLLILAALVTVYIVLGVLYESFIHPMTILSTLPSAGVGALLALMLFHQDLSMVAIIGIILLIGIVKKNGIMMVDFALEAERKHGKNATDAIYEACLLRFRPIMMTTMAALLAGLPLAFGTGFGSELRRPLGIAMVGGLLLSQVLTLYTTPVIYIFFDNLAQRFSPQSSRRKLAARNWQARHEHLRALHRAARGHDAADGGDRSCRGRSRSTVLPVSPLPEVDFPTISRQRQPAGGQRRHYGVVRRHSPGAAVRSYCGRDGDDLRQRARQHIASPFSSTSAATSTARRATWRPPSMRRALICLPTCRPTRPIARSIPPMRRS